MKENSKPVRLDKGINRGQEIQIFLDGEPIKAHKGETIAAALIGAGHLNLRARDSEPAGVYCNIGVCQSCVMTVNGKSSIRICKTLVSESCEIASRAFEKDKNK